MNKEETIVNAVAFVSGAAIGFGIGYYVQKRKYENWFAQEERALDLYKKEGVFATPQGAVKELIGDEIVISERTMSRDEVSTMLVEAGYAPLNGEDVFDADAIEAETGIVVTDPDPRDQSHQDALDDAEIFDEIHVTGEDIVNSIWQNAADREASLIEATQNEDQDSMPEPNPDEPYIITVDQFMTETKYDDNKVSLLYFQGDDQMVDEREQLVQDVDNLIGNKNLQHFGLGSRDRNALYIRNDKRKQDFEIIRDTRTYMEVIHGVKPDKQGTAPRKMREDDQ